MVKGGNLVLSWMFFYVNKILPFYYEHENLIILFYLILFYVLSFLVYSFVVHFLYCWIIAPTILKRLYLSCLQPCTKFEKFSCVKFGFQVPNFQQWNRLLWVLQFDHSLWSCAKCRPIWSPLVHGLQMKHSP